MKKHLIRWFAATMVALLMTGVAVTPISAVSMEADPITQLSRARWWPGDPNPEPGTEAWLQLHGSTTTSDPTVARRCAVQALAGAIIPGGIDAAVHKWILKGVFSVSSFALSFSISWCYGYFTCIV